MPRPPLPAGTTRHELARSGGARVEVELSPAELARLDALRGATPRATYLRRLLAGAGTSFFHPKERT